MRLLLTALVMALALNGIAVAQTLHPTKNPDPALEPTKLLPTSYKLEFENDWVRVVRVHYDAYAKLPNHEHPKGATVYLYLNASEGVLFAHDDNSAPVLRPPVKPGGMRIAVSALEHHTVTNTGNTPTDFIRIFLKVSDVPKMGNPFTRMPPSVMEYDHPMLHVQRINVQPHTKTRVEAKTYPIFRVAAITGEKEWRIAAKEGYRLLEKGTTEEFENTGDVPMQLVTIELRTPIGKTR